MALTSSWAQQVLILNSHISTRDWAGIQKSSFAVYSVVYNHSNPVRQRCMAAKDWLKNWKCYFFSLPKWCPRQNVFLCQILSTLCELASQTGVPRHISKLALKAWPLVFSFSTCQISFKFRNYTLWTTAEQQGKKNLSGNPLGLSSFGSLVALASTAWQTNTELGQGLDRACVLSAAMLVKTAFELKWSPFPKGKQIQHLNAKTVVTVTFKHATLLWNAIYYSTAGKFSAL